MRSPFPPIAALTLAAWLAAPLLAYAQEEGPDYVDTACWSAFEARHGDSIGNILTIIPASKQQQLEGNDLTFSLVADEPTVDGKHITFMPPPKNPYVQQFFSDLGRMDDPSLWMVLRTSRLQGMLITMIGLNDDQSICAEMPDIPIKLENLGHETLIEVLLNLTYYNASTATYGNVPTSHKQAINGMDNKTLIYHIQTKLVALANG